MITKYYKNICQQHLLVKPRTGETLDALPVSLLNKDIISIFSDSIFEPKYSDGAAALRWWKFEKAILLLNR